MWSPLSSATNSCAATKKNTSSAAFFRQTQFAGAVFQRGNLAGVFSAKRNLLAFLARRLLRHVFLARQTCQRDFPRLSPRRSASRFEHMAHLARLPFRVSCSLTAEAGRISRGPSAPQRSTPALFLSWVFSLRFCSHFLTFLSIFSCRFSLRFLLSFLSFTIFLDVRSQASIARAEVTSWPPCTSEQAISTAFLIHHCGTENACLMAQRAA